MHLYFSKVKNDLGVIVGKGFLIGFFMLALSVFSISAEVGIIPTPVSVATATGLFVLSGDIVVDLTDLELTQWVKAKFSLIPVSGDQSSLLGRIVSNLESDEGMKIPAEGYILRVFESGIAIDASDRAGLFYAIQSLYQITQLAYIEKPLLLPITIPCQTIVDFPRFEWRGMHQDSSRHFIPVDRIKQNIDLIAMHKGNRFHWHLTDDQGWRLEVKAWPLLTEKGGCRKGTSLNKPSSLVRLFDDRPYCGFYTQEEIKEVVAYAQFRNVTIVPEIDVPGHCLAAVHSYPELGCRPHKPVAVSTKAGGISSDILNPGPLARAFVKSVLDEVMELFPGQYIHIGGDEAPVTQWVGLEMAQQMIAEKNLKNERALYHDFINEITDYLLQKDKTVLGWGEMFSNNINREIIIMPWFSNSISKPAVLAGHKVLPVSQNYTYLDHPETLLGEPVNIGWFSVPLKRSYHYDPIPSRLDKKYHSAVLGSQAHLWAEFIRSGDHTNYLLFPRYAALMETLWTPLNRKDFGSFKSRVNRHQLGLAQLGIFGRLNEKRTLVGCAKGVDEGRAVIDISEEVEGAGIYQFDLKSMGQPAVITRVVLLADGKEVQVIDREAFSGRVEVFPIYSFLINDIDAKKWSLQVDGEGDRHKLLKFRVKCRKKLK